MQDFASLYRKKIDRLLPIKLSTRITSVDNDILRHLKEFGTSVIFYGVESGSQGMLNMLQKGITPNDSIVTLKNTRALGIMPQIGFIFFDPFMTIDELEENIQYLKRAGEFTYLSLQMIDQLRVFKNTDYARKYAQAANFTSRAFCYSYNFTDIDVEKFFQRWQEAFGALRVQDMAIRNHLDQILLAGNYLRHTPLIDAYHKIVLAYNNVVITVLNQIANCCDTMHIIDTYKKMVCEVLLMLEMTIKSLQTNQ